MSAAPSGAGPTTRSTTAAAPERRRGYGELIVDLAIVAGAAVYVWKAQAYPPAGREIPTIVGSIALIVGALQVVGWFVPRLWTLTHGDTKADPHRPAAASDTGVDTDIADTDVAGTAAASDGVVLTKGANDGNAGAGADAGADAGVATRRQQRDTVVVVAWAAGFVLAILVLGYRYAVPLFFLAYFGSRRQWKLAVGSAVVMWAVTQFVFIDLLGINLPTSQFFVF